MWPKEVNGNGRIPFSLSGNKPREDHGAQETKEWDPTQGAEKDMTLI